MRRIKDKEVELREDFPVSSWKMDSSDVKFVDNLYFDGKFVRVGREILLEAEVITHQLITCSRCLGEYQQVKKQQFNLKFNSSDLEDYLEIDEDIREQILLDFPMKVLCKPDCRGMCLGCGVNLNFEECKCQIKN